MPDIYAIIPARGGSKRIENKNITPINGSPMIGVTIKTLLGIASLKSVIVSTDSEQISHVSMEFGASCPFTRPSELSDDYTSTLDVMKHALQTLESISENDLVICVYPTAVLLTAEIYKSAIRMSFQINLSNQFLVSVAKYSHPIERALKMDPESKIEFIRPHFAKTRTQDLVASYFDAGQFYISTKSNWLNSESVLENGYGFEISKYSFIDIDYPEDIEEVRRRVGWATPP